METTKEKRERKIAKLIFNQNHLSPDTDQIERGLPPGVQIPGIWTFQDLIVEISASSGQNGVQVPNPISGFVRQMPLLKNNVFLLVVILTYLSGSLRIMFTYTFETKVLRLSE